MGGVEGGVEGEGRGEGGGEVEVRARVAVQRRVVLRKSGRTRCASATGSDLCTRWRLLRVTVV